MMEKQDKQLMYIVGVIALFIILMVIVGITQMGGGGEKEVQLLDSQLLKEKIERSKDN
ncbi:hypothetical protein [Nitrosococcus wardiae]|uniref:hypothetical protein n=1 Tax=Nitrosococcus wardiae TaxID=1814290 RepID=UPI00141B73EC|nr:hypothetical protein [Nitrosococcus wardiae]